MKVIPFNVFNGFARFASALHEEKQRAMRQFRACEKPKKAGLVVEFFAAAWRAAWLAARRLAWTVR
jgi:hypothetical protein